MIDIEYTLRPLLDAAHSTLMALRNDSSDLDELRQSISYDGVGATRNPVTAYITIKKRLGVWVLCIQAIADANLTRGESEIGRKTVKDMSQEAAKLLESIFNEHKGRNGRLLVQTDPRFHHNAKKLADQVEEFHNLTRNIVVKTPAAKTGLEAIEDVTSRGVLINVTVSFSMPQAVQAAETIERDLKAREAAGHDTSEMGLVVTTMVGCLDDWLKHVAARDGIFIDPSALEWADIAAMKCAYQISQERGYRAHVLVTVFRNVNQWTEFVGGDVVVSPPLKWQKIIADSGYTARERIADLINPHYIAELECIPNLVRVYEPDSMTVEEFEKFNPTRKTLRQLLAADADLNTLVRDIIVPTP